MPYILYDFRDKVSRKDLKKKAKAEQKVAKKQRQKAKALNTSTDKGNDSIDHQTKPTTSKDAETKKESSRKPRSRKKDLKVSRTSVVQHDKSQKQLGLFAYTAKCDVFDARPHTADVKITKIYNGLFSQRQISKSERISSNNCSGREAVPDPGSLYVVTDTVIGGKATNS